MTTTPPGQEKPGTGLVTEILETAPDDLAATTPGDGPLQALAHLITVTAADADQLHHDLVGKARHAFQVLNSLALGIAAEEADTGVLHSTGTDIDLLTARYLTTRDHLLTLTYTYQRLRDTAENPTPAPAPAPVVQQQATVTNTAPQQRRTRPAAPTAAQLTAMQALQRGGVQLYETRIGNARIDTGTASVRISQSTFRALETKGWASRDYSTSLYRGQTLSLTPEGERVLAASQAQQPRVRAALARSTDTTPDPAPEPPDAAPPTSVQPATHRTERHHP
jgi:hypothetical protein